MRALSPRPDAVFDPATGALRTGSYRGGLPPVDPAPLCKGTLFRVAHEKRWMYLAVAAEDLLVAVAVVRLGYAANAFAFAFDRAKGAMVASYTATTPSFAATVGDTGGEGCLARLRWVGAGLSFERGHHERDYRLEVATEELRISARLSTEGAPPAIGAVVSLDAVGAGPDGLFNATEKRALLPVVGEVLARGKHYSLDGGLGGVDFTFGFLARRTTWRWAFALGRARTAERVSLNLVQGFVGPAECAVWVDGEVYPVSAGVVTFDEGNVLAPWQVRTEGGEVDLRFEPGAVHTEEHDYRVVASRFLQPVGSFSGTIHLPGRAPLELYRVLGVVEDQAVTW
jgi:Protein of unknown function (DUF2804)